MAGIKRSVLITGCSDGGLGSELAVAFHNAGCRVFATTRNVSKMSRLELLGIQTLELDVLSETSIAACVAKIDNLDILVNNAGGCAAMPMAHLSLSEARKLFDLNVWSAIAVTQAFLPLLLKSRGIIVNQSSIVSILPLPFQTVYNASKAALAMVSATERLELAPFGVTVVELKTGTLKSNLLKNQKAATTTTLPEGSIYEPARKEIEEVLRGDRFTGYKHPPDLWAQQVVRDLLRPNPPAIMWRGPNSTLTWLLSFFPLSFLDKSLRKLGALDVLEERLPQHATKKSA
jgi:1-acylglycerone phosphate reductase